MRWLGECLCAVEVLRSPGVCGSTRHWRTRTCKGGYRSPLCNPRSRPTTSPLRGALASVSSLQVGRDTASCLSRPQRHIPAGLTWLVNCASAMLMPDIKPTDDIFVFSLRDYWRSCVRNLAHLLRPCEVVAGHNPHDSYSCVVNGRSRVRKFCVCEISGNSVLLLHPVLNRNIRR